MADQAIIVKRIRKGAPGHHGGAWKVAYADFVSAMMAFFLLLWLLNAVSQEQLEGISNYFAPASIAATTSGAGGILGGASIGQPGAMQAGVPSAAVRLDLPPPSAGTGPTEGGQQEIARETAEEVLRRREEEQFEQTKREILANLEQQPQFRQLMNSLLIDNTEEGLRIQIVDQEGLAMFPRGSAKMFDHTRRALELVVKAVEKTPQNIAITGHTDSLRFSGPETGYTNWELSADRANATRRALIELGIPNGRLARVVGVADTQPAISDPAAPNNRRVAIVLMRGTGQPKAEEEKPSAQ